MIGEENNDKIRSKTLPIENNIESKKAVDANKQAQILQIESQIRKMKQLVSMEVQLRKNKQQLQKVNNRLAKFQEDVKLKRKEVINHQLASIEKRREQRQSYNKESNAILMKIKKHNKQRRRRMESLVAVYKHEYDQLYQKKLDQRRRLMKLNLQDIRMHESGYLKVVKDRNSLRVKTQNCDYSSRNQPSQEDREMKSVKNSQDYEEKRRKIMQLVKKRKQYGEQAQKQAIRIKISTEIIKKVRQDKCKQTYDKNIDKYQQQRKKSYKPKLDTNFQGNIQQRKSFQLKKIANEQSPAKEKLTRLKNVADGYLLKYENGDQEALDKMCNVSLLRANVLLKDS